MIKRFLILGILAGCTEEVQVNYEYLYENRSCNALKQDLQRLSAEIAELDAVRQENAPANTAINVLKTLDYRAGYLGGVVKNVDSDLYHKTKHHEAARNSALKNGCSF